VTLDDTLGSPFGNSATQTTRDGFLLQGNCANSPSTCQLIVFVAESDMAVGFGTGATGFKVRADGTLFATDQAGTNDSFIDTPTPTNTPTNTPTPTPTQTPTIGPTPHLEIEKSIISNTMNPLAGSVIGYEIRVTVRQQSVNVIVRDTLPTDQFGNPLVTFISADCSSDDPTPSFVPPCVGGTAVEGPNGVLTWNFRGVIHAGTHLVMHLYVRLNDNLDEGTIVKNIAKVSDNQGNLAVSNPAMLTVHSSALVLSKKASDASHPFPEGLADGAQVPAGDLITYELSFTNFGSTAAAGVVIEDLLPPGETFVPGSATSGDPSDACTVCGSFNAGVIHWQFPRVRAGQTLTVSFRAQIAPNFARGGVLFNVSTAVDSTGHLAMATHSLIVSAPCLDMVAAVTCTSADALCSDMPNGCVAPDQPAPEDTVTFFATVRNGAGPACATANAVQIVDVVPEGLDFVSCDGGPCGFDGTTVTWTLDSVPPGGTATVAVTMRVQPHLANGTGIKNVATATASNGGKAATEASITVRPPILMLNALGSPSPTEPGGTINYQFTLSNAGFSCSKNASIVDTLPTNAEFLLGSLATVGCGQPSIAFSNEEVKLSVSGFDLKPGVVCSGSFNVVVPGKTDLGQTIVNTVAASDLHLNEAPSVETDISVQQRLMALSKVLTNCTVWPGGPVCPDFSNVPKGSELTYTLTVNTGPFVATGVHVTDLLPSPSVAAFAGTDCPSANLQGGVLDCSLGNIPPNSSASFQVVVISNDSNTPGTMIVNMATATDDALDILGVSNTVVDGIDVTVSGAPEPLPEETPEPTLTPELVLVPTPTPPLPPPATATPAVAPRLRVSVRAPGRSALGKRVTFHVDVTNLGNATAHNVVVSDTLPGALRLSRLPGTCLRNRATGAFTCNFGDLEPGESHSMRLQTRVRSARSAGGAVIGDMITHRVRVSSDETGLISGSALVTVTAPIR